MFYRWMCPVRQIYTGLICEPCAIREDFGSKYKQNKRYKAWIEKRDA